jgi:hypothetical protein
MTQARRKWTEDIIARFLDLCRRGVPRDIIAAEFGWTLRQLWHFDAWLRRKGRQPYRLELHSRWAPRNGQLRGHEAEIAEMSMAGLSAGQIAARFGVTKNAAAGFMDRHGLYAPDRRKRQGLRPLPVSVARRPLPPVEYDEADLRAGRALAEACG